jgi:hypothetical protein
MFVTLPQNITVFVGTLGRILAQETETIHLPGEKGSQQEKTRGALGPPAIVL